MEIHGELSSYFPYTLLGNGRTNDHAVWYFG